VLDALTDRYVPGEGEPTELPLAERLDVLPRRMTAPIKKLSKRVDNRGVTYTVEAYDRHKALDVLRERYWRPAEADDGLVTAIEAMRERGDVPDMSEDSDTHNTKPDDQGVPQPLADPDGAPPNSAGGDAKWHNGRGKR
jgi:hypothetical protein